MQMPIIIYNFLSHTGGLLTKDARLSLVQDFNVFVPSLNRFRLFTRNQCNKPDSCNFKEIMLVTWLQILISIEILTFHVAAGLKLPASPDELTDPSAAN